MLIAIIIKIAESKPYIKSNTTMKVFKSERQRNKIYAAEQLVMLVFMDAGTGNKLESRFPHMKN